MSNYKSANEDYVFGINLGCSSLSCSAYDGDTGRIIRFKDNQGTTISTKLAIEKATGKIHCGRDALNGWDDLNNEYYVVSSIKELLSDSQKINIDGKDYNASDLLSHLLNSLKERVKSRTQGILLEKAVFAVPSNMSALARKNLRQAAKRSKIEIIHMVAEPIAAIYNSYENIKSLSNILVIDWGAKKLSISLIENKENSLTEKFSGKLNIGGNDIDQALAKYIHNDLIQSGSENKIFADVDNYCKYKLTNKCEGIKRLLAKRPMAELNLTNYGNTIGLRRHVNSEELQDIIKPVVDKSKEYIEKLLAKNNCDLTDISYIMYVGGNFNNDYIIKEFKSFFNNKEQSSVKDSLWSTSIGAAKLALLHGQYYTTQSLNIMLSEGSLFKLVDANKDLDLVEEDYSFAVVEDCDNAYFIFCDQKGVQVGYLKVPVYGFFMEKIVVDIWGDNNNVIHIRACSDRKTAEFSREWHYVMPQLRYELPKILT